MFYVKCRTYLALSPAFVHVDNISKLPSWKSDWVVNVRLVATHLLHLHYRRSVWFLCWSLVSRLTTKAHILLQIKSASSQSVPGSI
jgi:hypothetical protein